jgi:hypothetical protein
MTRRSAIALRAAASLALLAVSLAAAGCGGDDDAALWGDSMSPTQVQKANWRSNVTAYPMTTTQGDSDDPFVDNPNYPFVEGPWWSNPAYDGG